MYITLAVIIVIILLIMIILNRDMIMINTIAYIGIKRGILSPNEFWWNISDMLTDPTGIKLFYKILNL